MVKISSGEKTESALIYTGPCLYYGFTCLPGGTNRTIKLYDNTSAAGTVIESFVADANKPTDGHSHSNPVECENGIYLSTTGGTLVVWFTKLMERLGKKDATFPPSLAL